MRRFRPRISLLTALLLMTIAGLAIVVVQLWREVEPLRAELRGLRQELGYLSIEDEGKIHAIQAQSPEPNVYRYRVFLPPNRQFQIHTRMHTIPARLPQQSKPDWFATLAGAGSTSGIESGEFTIDVAVRPDTQKPDHWDLVYRVAGRGGGSVGTNTPWLNDRRAWAISGEPSMRRQLEADPDDGLVLFALRQAKVKESGSGYSSYPPDESEETPGLMIWIAPASADE